MPEAVIKYFGQDAKVACDGKCNKAWGFNGRERIQLSEYEDDFVWLADEELGEAPECTGVWEGGHGKPKSVSEFPNKWCVRECERCSMSRFVEKELKLTDFIHRVYNIRSRYKVADDE